MEKYPSGSRGSPAKGVVCDKRSEGSNPSFSASKNLNRTLGLGSFLYSFPPFSIAYNAVKPPISAYNRLY